MQIPNLFPNEDVTFIQMHEYAFILISLKYPTKNTLFHWETNITGKQPLLKRSRSLDYMVPVQWASPKFLQTNPQ